MILCPVVLVYIKMRKIFMFITAVCVFISHQATMPQEQKSLNTIEIRMNPSYADISTYGCNVRHKWSLMVGRNLTASVTCNFSSKDRRRSNEIRTGNGLKLAALIAIFFTFPSYASKFVSHCHFVSCILSDRKIVRPKCNIFAL